MSTEPRTVHVNVLVTKSLEIDEPTWCVDPHDTTQFRPDITHNGPEVSARINIRQRTVDFLTAWVAHSPYSDRAPQPLPELAVEVGGDIINLAPDDVPAFTDLVRAHLDVIEQLAVELERIRGGGQ